MPLNLIALVGMLALQADTGGSVEMARTYRIESRTTGETRVIDVSLPASYGYDSTRR